MSIGDGHLDGCDLDFYDPNMNTSDSDVDALVLFADCWDDPAAVDRRREELIVWAWAAAVAGDV